MQQFAPILVERMHRSNLLRTPVDGPAFVGPLEQRPFEVEHILDAMFPQLLGETGRAVADRAVHDDGRPLAVFLERIPGRAKAGCAHGTSKVAGLELFLRPGIKKHHFDILHEQFGEAFGR